MLIRNVRMKAPLTVFMVVAVTTPWTAALAERGVLPSQRFGTDKLDVPAPGTEERKPKFQLSAPEEQLKNGGALSDALTIYVKDISFSGNTVFSDATLAKLVNQYIGRKISSLELEEIRLKITNLYIENGYINSGALIPDQELSNNVLRINIIEGNLSKIQVQNDGRLPDDYIIGRLAFEKNQPLKLDQLQDKLYTLQQNPRIKRINAALGPGLVRGESVLDVKITEDRPYHLTFEANNHRPPSIGEEEAIVTFSHLNVSGGGDTIELGASKTEGLDSYNVYYTWPLGNDDSQLTFEYYYSKATVVDGDLKHIDIDSKTYTATVGYLYPVMKRANEDYTLHFTLDLRHSETFLENDPTSFTLVANDGETDITALRLTQSWLHHDRLKVLSLRHTLSVGLHALGSTNNKGDLADSEYVAWLGQFQWVQQYVPFNVRSVFRTDMQVAMDELLPIEKFAVGGAYSVRGYRENQFVRDNGLTSSLEFRVPAFVSESRAHVVEAAVFYDFGRSWDQSSEKSVQNISSAGLGLRYQFKQSVLGEIYWTEPFDDINNREDDDSLQDDGIHVNLRINFF